MKKTKKATSEEMPTKVPEAIVEGAEVTEDEIQDDNTAVKLFPDFFPKEESTEEKTEEVVVEKEEVAEELQQPDNLTLDKEGDRKFKAVIDGEEREVTLTELVKGYQTDQHLSKKGTSVGERERQLADRERLLNERETSLLQKATQPTEELSYEQEETKKATAPLEMKIQSLEEQLNSIMPVVNKMAFSDNMDTIDLQLKNKGYDDFNNYKEKINQKVISLPPAEQVFCDANYFMNEYFQMKLSDSKVVPEPKIPEEETIPLKVVPNIEGAGGTPTGTNNVPDLAKLTEDAKRTGNWSSVYRAKGY